MNSRKNSNTKEQGNSKNTESRILAAIEKYSNLTKIALVLVGIFVGTIVGSIATVIVKSDTLAQHSREITELKRVMVDLQLVVKENSTHIQHLIKDRGGSGE